MVNKNKVPLLESNLHNLFVCFSLHVLHCKQRCSIFCSILCSFSTEHNWFCEDIDEVIFWHICLLKYNSRIGSILFSLVYWVQLYLQNLYRDTTYINTGIQGCEITEIQESRDAGLQKYRDTGMRDYRNTGIQGCEITGIQGYMDTGSQKYRDTWMRDHRNTRNTGIQWFTGIYILYLPCITISIG